MPLKIYHGDKKIFLCGHTDIALDLLKTLGNSIFLSPIDEAEIKVLMERMSNLNEEHIIITHDDTGFLKNFFFNHYELITAGGGLVINNDKEILFIFRRSKWDLPKGKMEPGENPEKCAEREVEEETGVTPLHMKYKITDTYHIYEEKGRKILKKTCWFAFSTDFKGTPKPQTEEDITSICWFDKENLDKPLSNTYESVLDVIEKGAAIF